MPNWKKMVEAFGRATHGRNNSENPAIKMARDTYERDLHNYVNDKDAGDRALQKDFEAEFEQAYKSALDRHDRQTARDIIRDDKDLASQGVSEDDVHKTIQTNRKLDGGFDSDDDIRAQMIEELKSGVDLSDFFEKYR